MKNSPQFNKLAHIVGEEAALALVAAGIDTPAAIRAADEETLSVVLGEEGLEMLPPRLKGGAMLKMGVGEGGAPPPLLSGPVKAKVIKAPKKTK